MAIIPSNSQFRGDTTGIPIIQRGSAQTNDRAGFFTMDDIKASVVDATSVTYLELKALVDSSGLVPSSNYLINDFQTIHIIANTTDINDANKVIPIEPLIVQAISSTTLAPTAKSTTYPQDVIYYNVDNTSWGTLEAAGSKGRIVRRINLAKDIDTPFDHKEGGMVYRRWALDTSTYNGGGLKYILPLTVTSCGKDWQSNGYGATNLTANNVNDYEDYFTFDFTKHIKNVLIGAPAWGYDPSGLNIVFKENAYNVQIEQLRNSHFEGHASQIFAGTAQTLICTHDFNTAGSEALGSYENLFVAMPVVFCKTSNLVNVTIAPDPSDFGLNLSLNNGMIIDLYSHSIRLERYDATNSNYNVNVIGKLQGYKSVSIRLKSKDDVYMPTIDNLNPISSNTTLTLDNTNGLINYKEGVSSTLNYSVAAAATLVASSVSDLAGIFNITGSGSVVITKIDPFLLKVGGIRTFILLKPVSGLTIQLTNNNIDFGIITNGKTYEANGTNSETIRLEWVNDRYYVTSGKTI